MHACAGWRRLQVHGMGLYDYAVYAHYVGDYASIEHLTIPLTFVCGAAGCWCCCCVLCTATQPCLRDTFRYHRAVWPPVRKELSRHQVTPWATAPSVQQQALPHPLKHARLRRTAQVRFPPYRPSLKWCNAPMFHTSMPLSPRLWRAHSSCAPSCGQLAEGLHKVCKHTHS